ncbi:YkvA family protein [Novosphingobium sp. AS3R-12]|uniref:YkvA family protein n=1 Tax=Novosphingobium aquae TaxID=3133435 RepID=A0ABU8S5J6_9SPHN
MKFWATALKRDVLVLWLASRDPRSPMAAKVIAAVTIGYALSPIDLIPDFIPVLGLLYDVLLIPAGVWLVLRLLPKACLWNCAKRPCEPRGR